MKTTIFENLIKKYNEKSFTHNYIYGFTFCGIVYAVTCTTEVMPYILKLDKASRGAGYSLRFRPTRAQKQFLLSKGAEVICSKDFFEATVKTSRYNRGEIFEKMVTEKSGQTWTKDSVPFTEAGDIEIEGIAYQIKFEGATFTNEKIIAGM